MKGEEKREEKVQVTSEKLIRSFISLRFPAEDVTTLILRRLHVVSARLVAQDALANECVCVNGEKWELESLS